MRRLWLRIAVVVSLAAIVAACPPLAASSARVTVRFQHQFNDAESAKLAELVRKFEAANPDIHVELIRDNAQNYYDKLTTSILGHSAPDIARVEPPKAVQYIVAGYAAPLDDYIPSGMRSQLFPGTIQPLIRDGKLYGLPQDVAVLVLFYRTDMFAAAGISRPPRTWDELLSSAKKLTRTPDQYGIGLFGGWGAFEFYPWLWQAGADMLESENGRYVAVFNSPEAISALQFWADLQNKHRVMPPGAATLTEDDMKGPFIAGKLAMFTSGPWCVESLKKAGIDGKWAIAPLPMGKEEASVLGGMGLILLAQSKHKEEAGKFLAWFMQDDVQVDWAKSLNLLPVKLSMYDDPTFMDDALLSQFKAALSVARSRPTVPQAGQIDDLLGQAVQAALSGAKSPKEALDGAVAKANEILSK